MYRYIFILFSLSPLLLFSQERKELSFIHFNTIHGLSSNEASEIIQDKQGFIWIGTVDGLNRFDGYNFKVYRTKINDPMSLCDNYISKLFLDSKGNLWVGTRKGLSLYNRDYDSFYNFYPYDGDYSSQSNLVTSIVEDNSGNLYVSLDHGIYKFDHNTNTFKELLDFKPEIKFLLFDSDSLFWILTDKDIYICNYNIELKDTLSNPTVCYPYKYLVEDGDKFWIGTEGDGFFWIDRKSREFTKSFQYDIYQNFINNIYKDRNNNIWIGCNSSLKLYDRQNDIFHYYYYYENDKHSFSSSGLISIFQDINGNYWILTAKGGINLSLAKKQFTNITSDPESKLSLTKRVVSSLYIDSQNRLWAGAFRAGLDIIDFDAWEVTHMNHDPTNSNSLAPHSVFTLFEDSQKNFWVGTFRGGLQLFNEQSGTFTTFKHNPDDKYSIGGDDVRAMVEDKDGNLWLATAGGGLNKLDRKTNRFYQYRQNPDDLENSLINDWLYTLNYDSDGNIWIGSSFGLSMFNIEREKFTNYFNNPSDTTTLSNSVINYIYEDSKKNIWIGTNDGLNQFLKETNTFESFLQKDGLPNSVIKGILEDDHGNLWISTSKGISKFNPETKIFRNYNKHDGLSSDEFSSGACAKNKNGKLFFGCENGVVSFYPDSIRNILGIPSVYITGLKLFNKPVKVGEENSPLVKDILQTKELVLKHYQSDVISFEFVSISYIQSERNQYAYMMEGFDLDWIYCGNKREATYTNLDPGKYTFRAKASNHDNIWNEEGAYIYLTILPPWWNTILFRFLASLFLTGILISFYLLKTNSLHKQKHKLEKLVKERTKEIEHKNSSLTAANATKDKMFSIIAHDLKNPFNSIIGFSQLLDRRYENLEDAKRRKFIKIISNSSETIYNLLENLLQWARSQTGSMKFEPVKFNLNALILSNIDLLQNLFNQKNIRLNLNIPEDIEVYADINMVSTVVRNLISNAFKFTEKGEIKISAAVMENNVEISVKDTGIGLCPERLEKIFNVGESNSTIGTQGETGTGLGLIICKEFVEKNGGSISIKSKVNQGTTFKILLPKQV